MTTPSSNKWKLAVPLLLTIALGAVLFMQFNGITNLQGDVLPGTGTSSSKNAYTCGGKGHAMECALGTCPDGQRCIAANNNNGDLLCQCTKVEEPVSCCEYGSGATKARTRRCQVGANCASGPLVGRKIGDSFGSFNACEAGCNPSPPDAVFCCENSTGFYCSSECTTGRKRGIFRDTVLCGLACGTRPPPYDDWCSKVNESSAAACKKGMCIGTIIDPTKPDDVKCGVTKDDKNPANCECSGIGEQTVRCCTDSKNPDAKVCTTSACPPGFTEGATGKFKSINEAWDWCATSCKGGVKPHENVCCKKGDLPAKCTTLNECLSHDGHKIFKRVADGLLCSQKCNDTFVEPTVDDTPIKTR
ncbi:MAG: hypothetical protein ABL890_00625 [Candidatus Peribacteraceae bacterium]